MAYSFSRTPVDVIKVQTAHRNIRTAIPAPGTDLLMQELEKCESRSMQGQLPIVWDRAEDFSIFDSSGNQWIDFTSSIFVANTGHGNSAVTAAMREALEKPLLHSYAYTNRIRIDYIKRLIDFTNGHFEKAFLLSAGTEATEAALKLMRMYGQKKGKRSLGIISIEGNWHGRTMGAQLLSANADQKKWVGYDEPFIHHIPFPYPWRPEASEPEEFLLTALNQLAEQDVKIERDICGFMLETFQGWGALFYPKDFVQCIQAICKKHDIVLCFDEMQSGFARTGKRFGYEHYGVVPDLICCGKGMGSGAPLSGVIGRADIMDLPEVGNMSSTHSAGPLVCAAGLATLDEIERLNLVAESARKGALLHARLAAFKQSFTGIVSGVYGKGLIAAILFKDQDTGDPDKILASRIAERCMQKGLLVVHTGRESIKIGPPLTITDEALNEGLNVMEEAILGILHEDLEC